MQESPAVTVTRQQRTGAILALTMIFSGRGAAFRELARFRVEVEALSQG
jgi:hypothetical protein